MQYLYKNRDMIITINTLAFPVIIENILQTLLGTVDTYFAGHISDNAIAAIGVTNLVVNLFIAFFTAISIGTSAVIARNVGKGDIDKVDFAMSQSIILGIVISIIFGVLNALFYIPILRLCGATKDILNITVPYYIIISVPIIFLCLSLILSSCLRSTKDTKTPMISTAIANILNILLNIIFIKLNLGIAGLALATTISRGINVIFLFHKLKNYNFHINLNFNNWKEQKLMLKSIIKIGLPAGVEKLIMRLGQLMYNSMIITIGISAYVAHNIAGNIESYTYIPAMGFGVATATLVGITLGEGNYEESKKLVYISDIITTFWMVIMGIFIYIFAPYIVKLFTNTLDVQVMVVEVLRLIALFQCFIAITQIFTSALQGAGDTKFPMYITLMGIWGIRLGVGYLLGVVMNMGLMGVWIAYVLDIMVRSILLIIRFIGEKWQEIVI